MPDDQPPRNSGNNFLAFIVGGLLVAVVVLGWLYYRSAESSNDVTISIDGKAVDAVEGAVKGD